MRRDIAGSEFDYRLVIG